MKKKDVISGAMIVATATGVYAASDRVAAATPSDTAQLKITAAGPTGDTIRLDDDVLRLGGLAKDPLRSGVHGDSRGFRTDDDALYLAQTVYGGESGRNKMMKSGNMARVPGTTPMVVTDPRTQRSTTVLFNERSKVYYDAQNGKAFTPPQWMRQQIER